jgi:hypothetical protein
VRATWTTDHKESLPCRDRLGFRPQQPLRVPAAGELSPGLNGDSDRLSQYHPSPLSATDISSAPSPRVHPLIRDHHVSEHTQSSGGPAAPVRVAGSRQRQEAAPSAFQRLIESARANRRAAECRVTNRSRMARLLVPAAPGRTTAHRGGALVHPAGPPCATNGLPGLTDAPHRPRHPPPNRQSPVPASHARPAPSAGQAPRLNTMVPITRIPNSALLLSTPPLSTP